MASNVRYKPNVEGMKQMLNTPEVRGVLMDAANNVAARANGMFDASGYGVSAGSRSEFPKAFVYTGDIHTMRSNRLHNTLLKSLQG